ncbi:hypothetical protein ACQ86F_31745 [Streptomyces venezuelae ATCC 10712]
MTRATAARARRAETARVLAGRLDRIAIGHLDGLTPAEAALLAETVRAMTADVEHLARDRLGLARARSADIEKRKAAEDAIVEAEKDRDQATAAIDRVRETAACWEQMPADRHVHIREAARSVRYALDQEQPLRDETGQPICTCTHEQRCPACPPTTKEN